MLQDRYQTDKVFSGILKLTNEMDPILAQIDKILDDDEIFQLIKADWSKRYPKTLVTGRNSTPVEVILRMLAVKRLYSFSYEDAEYQVRDSLVLRQFCRVYLNDIPDDTTLIRWANLIQPETLEKFNQRVTHLATQLKITRGRKMRTDGTVVESNIHPPTDNSLLADGVRVLGRTLQRAKQVLADESSLGQAVFRNRVRSARQTARQISETLRKGGETAYAAGQAAYGKLVNITQATVEQAQQVLTALKESTAHEAHRLAKTLETFIPRTQQAIEQTLRRVFQGEKVPAGEKIVSLFEPHTDIIRRDKLNRPVEYGHKVWLDEVDGGLVSHYRVLEGNPHDSTQWEPSLDHHAQQFGHPPHLASADRGVYSEANETYAQGLGVTRVVLPKSGYKSEERRRYEKQPWFKRGRKWQSGIEGRISVLKRGYHLARCLDHGLSGFKRWVGWGIIAANLKVMGRTLAARRI
jgi:transposase, IS5 family